MKKIINCRNEGNKLKLSDSPNIKRMINKQKKAIANVNSKGFEYLPSVVGPYIWCPISKKVLAAYGSDKFQEICFSYL